MYQIIIAPNSFKGSLSAVAVAKSVEKGLKKSALDFEAQLFPIADGGDYTAHLLTSHLKGEMFSHTVEGAYGDLIEAQYGFVEERKMAILEIAETSGFKTITGAERKPMLATTYGLGQLIRHVITQGAKELIICLGGSATVDGGIGMLSAMGVRFYDENKALLRVSPSNFNQVKSIDPIALNDVIGNCKLSILCDVTNPLLGKNGAASVFGPQKGANAAEVAFLEDFLSHFDELTRIQIGRSLADVTCGGAAGGVAAVCSVYLGAELQDGASYFCELTDFKKGLAESNLLITGEGSLDEQSINGKAPFVVARMAQEAKIPVIGIAGKIPLKIPQELANYFNAVFSIGHQPESLQQAIEHTEKNIVGISMQIGNLLAFNQTTKI